MTFDEETKDPKDPLEGRYVRGARNPLCPAAPRSAAQQGYSCDRQLLVHRRPPGSRPAVTDVTRMCREAGTHTSDTNHRLRATATRELTDQGLEARKTMAERGHR